MAESRIKGHGWVTPLPPIMMQHIATVIRDEILLPARGD